MKLTLTPCAYKHIQKFVTKISVASINIPAVAEMNNYTNIYSKQKYAVHIYITLESLPDVHRCIQCMPKNFVSCNCWCGINDWNVLIERLMR